MGDAAEKLAEAIRALMPAPIAPPEWVQLSVEAKRRGMETRNLLAWVAGFSLGTLLVVSARLGAGRL